MPQVYVTLRGRRLAIGENRLAQYEAEGWVLESQTTNDPATQPPPPPKKAKKFKKPEIDLPSGDEGETTGE